MSESLYALSTALQTAIEGGYTIDEETGEILWSPDQLDELELAVRDKAEACAVVLKGKRAFAQAIKDEIDALQKRLSVVKAQAERLDGYIMRCVELNGGAIETPRCRLSTRKSNALEILDESAIPSEYIRMKTTTAPDKMAIKAALKDGREVPGCALVVNEHLQVR